MSVDDELDAFMNSYTDDNEIEVIDTDAQKDNDLEDSYAGKVILDCKICHSKLYKNPEEVEIDESGELVNKDEECPYCYSTDGFKIIGQVQPYDPEVIDDEESDISDDEDDEPINIEIDGEEIELDDSDEDESEDEDIESDDEDIESEDDLDESLNELFGINKKKTAAKKPVNTKSDENSTDHYAVMYTDKNGDTKCYAAHIPAGHEQLEAKTARKMGYDDVFTVDMNDHPEYSKLWEAIDTRKARLKEACLKRRNRLVEYTQRDVTKYANEHNLSPTEAENILKQQGGVAERGGISGFVQGVKDAFNYNQTHDDKKSWSTVNAEYNDNVRNQEQINKQNLSQKDAAEAQKSQQATGKKYDPDSNPNGYKSPIGQGDINLQNRTGTKNDPDLNPVKAEPTTSTKPATSTSTKSTSSTPTQQPTTEIPKQEAHKVEEPKQEAPKGPGAGSPDYNDGQIRVLGPDQIDRSTFGRTATNTSSNISISNADTAPISNSTAQTLSQPSTTTKITNDFNNTDSGLGPITNDRQANDDLVGKAPSAPENESLTEDFESATITTDKETLSMNTNPDGGISVTTTPKILETETLAPITDDTISQIKQNSEEDSNQEEPVDDIDIEEIGSEDIDMPIEEVDEESINQVSESYLKRVYENVNSFRVANVFEHNNKLVIEGIINFNSGNSKKTTFIYEAFATNKDGSDMRFIGENSHISKNANGFQLNGKLNNKKFIAESLTYNYDNISGTIKR